MSYATNGSIVHNEVGRCISKCGFCRLDTSPFIYFVERNPLYVDIMRDIFRRITDGNFKASSSVITITEVLVQPFRHGNQKLVDSYNDLLFSGINFRLTQ